MRMRTAIYGLYSDPDAAQRAVNVTREAGIDRRAIVVVSSEPFEEYEFGHEGAKTTMPWIAALGGLLGGVSGYLLAALTQRAYPIPTGGMPIVALWPDGIITYELTMLGAILATLFVFRVDLSRSNWGKNLYDHEVTTGKILVGVVNPPPESYSELEKRLREAGAVEVKELQRSSFNKLERQ